MSGVKLDWSSAEVRNGKLEVPLDGEQPPGWKQRFERTVALLGGGNWGDVKVRKGRVSVAAVVDGDESRLHHFLESIVLEANAAHEDTEPEAEEDQDPDDDKPDGPDAEMTDRFRAFASEPDDEHRG